MSDASLRFRLAVGVVDLDVTLRGVLCESVDELLAGRLSTFVTPYGTPGDAHRPTITCDWEFTGTDWQPYEAVGGGEAPVARRVADDRWFVEWCYYRLDIGHDACSGTLTTHPISLEHALRGAAIFATMPRRALYFHAATLVFDDRAFLIAGHSGAGKSTISREGGAQRVISNEISIIARRGDGWVALPSPFWGSGDRAERAAEAPLEGVVVLTQAAEKNEWRRLQGAKGVAHVMPHVGCQAAEQLNDPELLAEIGALTGELPLYTLAWHRKSPPLQGSPWKP